MDLLALRDKIDVIDAQIVALFEDRMKIAEDVARFKIETGKAVYDSVREKAKIQNAKAMAHTPFNANGVEAVFRQMMAVSRVRQYEMVAEIKNETFGFELMDTEKVPERVVFQGVEGAYGYQAMKGYFGEEVANYHVATFEDVMKEVQEGRADFGVLPVENSSTGIITDVYDLFNKYDNYIVGEYVVKVEHTLIGLKEASIDDIKIVYSHPQGLMQCSGFLNDKNWEQVSLQNTAVSAKKVKTEGKVYQAAIASKMAAEMNDLKVLQTNISDNKNNSTRFIIIGNKRVCHPEANEVSITFELAHETGSLYHILSFIMFNNLNMTKIESRPIQGEKWHYRFFINFDGNIRSSAVRDALKGIEKETVNFKILGSYINAD